MYVLAAVLLYSQTDLIKLRVSYITYFQVDNWGPGSGVVKLGLILHPEKGRVEPVGEDDKIFDSRIVIFNIVRMWNMITI